MISRAFMLIYVITNLPEGPSRGIRPLQKQQYLKQIVIDISI